MRGRRRAGVLALALALAAAGCAGGAPPAPRPRAGAIVVGPPPPPEGGYLGSAACRECHPRAWENWARTGHARALRTLGPRHAADASCLRCHATGFGEPGGFRDPGRTPGLAGVGCESCHGPGADHARSRHPALVPTEAAEDCPPCELNRVCRLCHTPTHSPAFELAPYLARVSCSR